MGIVGGLRANPCRTGRAGFATPNLRGAGKVPFLGGDRTSGAVGDRRPEWFGGVSIANPFARLCRTIRQTGDRRSHGFAEGYGG
jgi:hypothetical protein